MVESLHHLQRQKDTRQPLNPRRRAWRLSMAEGIPPPFARPLAYARPRVPPEKPCGVQVHCGRSDPCRPAHSLPVMGAPEWSGGRHVRCAALQRACNMYRLSRWGAPRLRARSSLRAAFSPSGGTPAPFCVPALGRVTAASLPVAACARSLRSRAIAALPLAPSTLLPAQELKQSRRAPIR